MCATSCTRHLNDSLLTVLPAVLDAGRQARRGHGARDQAASIHANCAPHQPFQYTAAPTFSICRAVYISCLTILPQLPQRARQSCCTLQPCRRHGPMLAICCYTKKLHSQHACGGSECLPHYLRLLFNGLLQLGRTRSQSLNHLAPLPARSSPPSAPHPADAGPAASGLAKYPLQPVRLRQLAALKRPWSGAPVQRLGTQRAWSRMLSSSSVQLHVALLNVSA